MQKNTNTDLLKTRIQKLNSKTKSESKIVAYIMSRDMRVQNNHALRAAQLHASATNSALVVFFVLYPKVKNRIANQFLWVIDTLQEIEEELHSLNISFAVVHKFAKEGLRFIDSEYAPDSYYFDYSPLRNIKEIKNQFAEQTKASCFVVDTHNIVPVSVASKSQEVAAQFFRKKLFNKLPTYLESGVIIEPENINMLSQNKTNWEMLKDFYNSDILKNYKPVAKAGRKAAIDSLHNFVQSKLENYSVDRNKPEIDGTSLLSTYLHYGVLSSLEIVQYIKHVFPTDFALPGEVVNPSDTKKLNIQSFLNELIVWKELAENYCTYNTNYDNPNGASAWALKTLEDHKLDAREHVYTIEEFEFAKTHDPAWNAAQNQLLQTGRIHGYMRMYWAKKILEWTPNASLALKTAIYLNDKYQMDGYDPNGYTGCMWSIYGIHDRGWTERPIFGKIRYMNYAGLKRKFNIHLYEQRWNSTNTLF